ncbi:protein of unknown function DUF928 [[Leptolyngbya] sp. PCC 7376]|uniref:DUF928 domain-containing protein n=1 Tax=[Leptolyngbya] sp. PCC 7376 TaxID=111781 RepID=UPI00029F1AC7|nr:DUF928 domain-containing protein [[Leptolyngbya] sp. PCC 7376]AFY39972.1 protein of unknown function DUF928 [[Leptolyngbya] sp. PCC 7376]
MKKNLLLSSFNCSTKANLLLGLVIIWSSLSVDVFFNRSFSAFATSLDSEEKSETPTPPPNNGAPDNTVAGGSRGECTEDSTPIALAPRRGTGAVMSEGSTKLYFFIPQGADLESSNATEKEKDTLTFSFTDVLTGESLSETKVEADTPSLLTIDLALLDTPISLETNRRYRWNLTLECETTKEVDKQPSVSGSIQKREFDAVLISESEKLALSERPIFFSNNWLQYDAITALIEWVKADPTDPEIKEVWRYLLPDIPFELVKPGFENDSDNQEIMP